MHNWNLRNCSFTFAVFCTQWMQDMHSGFALPASDDEVTMCGFLYQAFTNARPVLASIVEHSCRRTVYKPLTYVKSAACDLRKYSFRLLCKMCRPMTLPLQPQSQQEWYTLVVCRMRCALFMSSAVCTNLLHLDVNKILHDIVVCCTQKYFKCCQVFIWPQHVHNHLTFFSTWIRCKPSSLA